MSDQVQSNTDDIRQHLEEITESWASLGEDAVFELRFLTAQAPAEVKNVARFRPDQIDEAVDHAEAMNKHRLNAYVTINPIRPDVVLPGKAAADAHIIAARYCWADADTEQAAKNILSFAGPKHTMAVVTGRTPHTRPHIYWELDEWHYDLAEWSALQRRIAATLGTDPAVINPSRIMRLAGTINWPNPKKIEKGYVPEVATLRVRFKDPRPPVGFAQMLQAFSNTNSAPVERIHPDDGTGFDIDTGPAPLDRERTAIQAMEGQEWHNAVIKLVASYTNKGLSDAEIHALTDPLTLDGYTVDQTRREVQTAIDGARAKGWAPEEYAKPEEIDWGTPAEKPDLSDKLEWFDDVQPALTDNYLVKGVIGDGAMSVVYGPSNSGKTFFALDLAYHIATGQEWRGRRVRQAAVLYLAAEGGRGIANRIVALRRQHGLVDVPFALRRAGLDLLKDQADLQQVYDLAMEVKKRNDSLAIVIDTLSRVMAGGDENSAADMTALIRNIDAIREATGAHIMLVHHTGKDTARGARGHSSLRAATDTEIEVQQEDGARAAVVSKQRDYEGGQTFAFSLKEVPLGIDQDGDQVSTCVLEIEDSDAFDAKTKLRKGLGGNQKLIADCFDLLIGESATRPNPGGVGLPEPGRFHCVEMDALRQVVYGKMVAENKRDAFRKAWEGISNGRGLFCSAQNLVWAVDRKV